MNSKHSLLVQPEVGEFTDLEDTYNCVCLEIPEPVATEAKDYASTEWHGEDGVDVYVPSSVRMKAFDWKIKCGIKASSRSSLTTYYDELISLLSLGKNLKVYSSLLERGREKVLYKGVEDVESFIDAAGMSVMTFTLCLWCTDPTTEIRPDNDAEPTELV